MLEAPGLCEQCDPLLDIHRQTEAGTGGSVGVERLGADAPLHSRSRHRALQTLPADWH